MVDRGPDAGGDELPQDEAQKEGAGPHVELGAALAHDEGLDQPGHEYAEEHGTEHGADGNSHTYTSIHSRRLFLRVPDC